MKAQHRKELERNALAERLGGVMQGLKEGPSRNTLLVGGLIVLAVVLVFVWRLVAHSAEERSSERWLKLEEAASVEDLEAFIRENADKPQARLARFQLARRNLYQGLRDLGSLIARDDALKSVRDAAEAYEKLARESGDTPALAQEALLNGAKARETLGDTDSARRLYEQLARTYPDSADGKQAAEQLKRLDEEAGVMDLLKRELADSGGRAPVPPPPPPPQP